MSDLLAASPESLEESVDVIISNGAHSFVAGLGVPMPIMKRLKSAGIKVMVVGGAVKHAIKAEQAGCDAVILQGGEGGGHTGLVGTLPLVAQAVEAVKIPVIAAGGIYDGRGLAAALSLVPLVCGWEHGLSLQKKRTPLTCTNKLSLAQAIQIRPALAAIPENQCVAARTIIFSIGKPVRKI